MADQDEVLELQEEQVIEEEVEETKTEDTEEHSDDDAEEVAFSFDGDGGAAPVPESESSVIRELRERNRELNARLKAAEAKEKPEQIEVGPEPELDDPSIDWDADKFKVEWQAWNERRQKAERLDAEKTKEQEAQQKVWAELERTYEADKAALKHPNFDEAETEVAAILPESHRVLLLKSGKGAALVAALHRSPTTLDELSKLDPAEAAMKIGELRSKLTMTNRSRPNPDVPVKGNAASTSADKELARLEKEAERTGDRTALIQYRKRLRQA